MSMLARVVATGAGLLISATTLSFIPSNEWWIRVLDFPRLQIAVASGVVLAACPLLIDRGRWRTLLLAGLAFALLAQLVRVAPYTTLVEPEVASADSCGDETGIRVFIANVEYANRDSRDLLAMWRPSTRTWYCSRNPVPGGRRSSRPSRVNARTRSFNRKKTRGGCCSTRASRWFSHRCDSWWRRIFRQSPPGFDCRQGITCNSMACIHGLLGPATIRAIVTPN